VLNATGGRRVEQPIVQKAGQSLVLSCSHVIRSIPPDTKSWWLATHGSVAGDIAVTLDDRVIVAENGRKNKGRVKGRIWGRFTGSAPKRIMSYCYKSLKLQKVQPNSMQTPKILTPQCFLAKPL